jgi:cardiolipin synthase
MPIVKTAAALLYEHLQAAGVRIHEYCLRPLHGKVAVVDDDWATVGSSNLDPLSLSLNLEANVVLRDTAFAARLRGRLEHLIADECKQVAPAPRRRPFWRWWVQLRTAVVFHFLRRFPGWVSWLPRHVPELQAHHRAHAAGQRGAQ